MALRGYPIAKRALIEQGRTRRKKSRPCPCPKSSSVTRVQTYNELRDRMFKWFFVPYPQARGRQPGGRRYLKRRRKREIVPLASLLLPAIGSVHFQMAKSERSVAMLRVIEALRIYAARHQGRLPDKLADISEVPVPVDPTTGQAFVYQKNRRHRGDRVAVSAGPLAPRRPAHGSERDL